MSAATAQEPITTTLSKHGPELAIVDAVRAADFVAMARSRPLDQSEALSDPFGKREVHSAASRRYLIASDARIRVS